MSDPVSNPDWLNHSFQPISDISTTPNLSAPATLTFQDLSIIKGNFDHFRQYQADTTKSLSDTSQAILAIQSQLTAPNPPLPPPPSVPSAPSVIPMNLKPPSFNTPPTFKGKASEVDMFIAKILDVAKSQGTTLLTDQQKCMYMAAFFGEDSPSQWYYAMHLSCTTLLNSFTNFVDAFKEHFGDSNLAYNAGLKLKKLVQTGSAAAHAC
ncbi:hypothetical protein GYMLUDRAFT_60725 [Collybiopsis luxurians FD-317 M1]|uniref:Unplaced genomic scaffold GYMLUscaffold_37, whole genome shotgun sequence n=1 Tax=Collybiopsis luxurians FD-317 M1 TaxID=944289 RepID=A0A0D0BSZ8_9AGAR|nr:hypothetical protein GYMLUDRAFT_60725 [Collybiopsis luxurians FD-317 M1]